MQRNKQPPKLIFIFRDGVSEGEFQIVETSEEQALYGKLRCVFILLIGYILP